MTRQRIIGTSITELKKRHWNQFYRHKRHQTEALTEKQEVAWGIIRLSAGTTEADLVNLETAIEAINGIETCELPVSGQVPAEVDTPMGYNVHARLEGCFTLEEQPE